MPTTKSCSSSDVCWYGVCDYTPDGGGCSWLYSGAMGTTCSSGCPSSYPNQQYTCCSALSGCNPGTSGCASYDPIKGETPCCTAGGYYTCTAQETCTASGYQNVCTTGDKQSELYCPKCPSCQDGETNCA